MRQDVLFPAALALTLWALPAAVPAAAEPPTANIVYFKFDRAIHAMPQPTGQDAGARMQYIVLDAAALTHAKRDLSDLRVYSGNDLLPFSLVAKNAVGRTAATPLHLLNKGTTGGRTTFLLEMPAGEFDSLELDLDAHDYIATVAVEGAASFDHGQRGTSLGQHAVFDFSRKGLGANPVVRLDSPIAFAFLRLTIDGPIKPDQVRSVSARDRREEAARFIDLPLQVHLREEGKKTVATWEEDENLPLERVEFRLAGKTGNFARPAELWCEGNRAGRGEISVVHLQDKGRKVDHEELSVMFADRHCKTVRVQVDNGDDPPLKLSAIVPQTTERRIYFQPPAAARLRLLYGDKELAPPVYDFARFFHEPQADTIQASLGDEHLNAEFRGRPDTRPWSERHPIVLWIALGIAVIAVAGWALKGFREP